MITAAGAGSGIDVESIITQLMQLERQPIEAIEAKKSALDTELSAFGKVKSSLNELATKTRTLGDATKFGPFTSTSSNEDVLTASASGVDVASFHDIEVVSLAQAHRFATEAVDPDDTVFKTGTWSFGSGNNTFDVQIDGTNRTLVGMRNAINDAEGNNSVAASIINVEGGTRLVLTAREAGTANAITMTAPGSSQGQGSGFFSEVNAATDAVLKVDGFDVTRSGNTISDVIEGVTLELRDIGTVKIDNRRDQDGLKTSLEEFVTQYNATRDELKGLAEGELQGDRMPRNVEARLRSVLAGNFEHNGRTYTPLNLGFSFDRFGTLSLDAAQLDETQKDGLEAFVSVFTDGDSGFAQRMESVIDEYVLSTGLIKNREDGVDSRQRSYDRQIERAEYLLGRTEERLRRQYGAMDEAIAQLKSSAGYLVQSLNQQE